VSWRVILGRHAVKDLKRLAQAGLKSGTKQLLDILAENPCQNPPRYEKLVGNLDGYHSRRINIQHRLVYRIDERERMVQVLRMWSYYE